MKHTLGSHGVAAEISPAVILLIVPHRSREAAYLTSCSPVGLMPVLLT